MSAWVGIKRPISPAQGHGERRLEEIKEITKDGESAGRFSFAGEVTAGNGPQHGPVRVIEVYPDGGRGWLVCFSVFLMNFGAWGCNLALSIYMSHYISEAEDFRDIPRSTTSLISGSSLSLMLIVAPFSNYIENMIGIRNCVALGAVINSLGLYLASISTRIEYLLLTQAVIAGIGRGLVRTVNAF